ncbi:hypothetical protein ABB37_03866 [Leptomonas pyrrhocoris]|uniref:U3 small nucleolar RNA-associated protein 18 n=1 Tax=Leptomonas pyrrhocoris TaxID=157538 RepID=A0A0M9G3C4_LEPPY|nr:hypothetical protein ABB37_03866 [Leptomonas pyrrhocoris]KPA81515.1 hypothetical protein ABB37_03866 [Leptomonas pyrrhocoris]|eukprot:XP_015659954.1 hypothetical protein ABB37_03866 [Leptomonas pyrrhocoris]
MSTQSEQEQEHASPVAAPSQAPKNAWVDDEDAKAEHAVPAFLKESTTKPSWALSDNARALDLQSDEYADASPQQRRAADALARKRFRSEDLDTLLSRKEPLLSSKHDRPSSSVPKVLSVLPLPRDSARTIHWHSNGQLAIVGGNHHLYAFHAAGGFVEQLSKVEVGKRVETTALSDSGEEVLIAAHEAYAPLLMSIATEQLIPLTFLDTRDTAVHRNGRRDNVRHELFITKLACKPNDPVSRGVAVARGSTVTLASLSSGSVLSHITVDAPITDVNFVSATELAIATRNKVLLYDVRRSNHFTRELTHEGVLDITACAFTGSGGAARTRAIAVGSASGVVSVYDSTTLRSAAATTGASTVSRPRLMRELKQLVTPISCLCFGENSQGDSVLAFATGGQKGGFRVARLPELNVVPSFPAVSTRHGFVQSMTIAPTVPILSVGERQKVTNYAL